MAQESRPCFWCTICYYMTSSPEGKDIIRARTSIWSLEFLPYARLAVGGQFEGCKTESPKGADYL